MITAIISAITGFFGGDFLSLKTLVLILIGMLIGWHIPMPTWATTFWTWVGSKFPSVETVTTDVVNEVETVVTDVTSSLNVVKDVEDLFTPSSTTTTTTTDTPAVTTPVVTPAVTTPVADVTTPVVTPAPVVAPVVEPVVAPASVTPTAPTTPPASN